jgi:hypothetical protein
MRSNGICISPSAQITFCTLDEVLRPQTFSIVVSPGLELLCPAQAGHPVSVELRASPIAIEDWIIRWRG